MTMEDLHAGIHPACAFLLDENQTVSLVSKPQHPTKGKGKDP
jgi:hypothetical protein